MNYSSDQLKALRDNIDLYLKKSQNEDMKIYETLENSITKAVKEGIVEGMKQAQEQNK